MDARHSLFAASLLAMASLYGCSDGNAAVEGVAASPTTAGGPTRVRVVQPEVTTLRRTTTQPVTVHPYHEANIDAKVSGYLTELNVDIGDIVKQGDVLAILAIPEMSKEIEEQQAVIARLHAEENQATAAVDLASANIQASQAVLAQVTSQIEQANADLKAEQAEFDRIEELVRRKSVESRMLDEARQRLESAQAGKSSAEAAIASAEANVAVAEAKFEVAQAEVGRANAETAIAQKQLEKMHSLMEYASLTAPFDGVVSARTIDLGELVRNAQASSGQREALFTVGQVNRVRVRAAVPENDAPWTTGGDVVTVRFSALRGQAFSGTVSRVSKTLDNSTRTMIAEIDLENPDGHLLPGMYGEASFVLAEKPDALVLPASAVRFDAAGKAYVYTVDNEGTVHLVDVSVGIDDGHHIEVLSGISAGDRVVDGMLDRLSAGQHVQVDE